MPAYKVYRKNNYLFVQDTVTDEIISGLAKDVRVYRLEKTGGNFYKFVNTSDDVRLASVPYTSIKEEDGTAFADEDAWRTFYTQYTGTQATGGGGGSQSLSQVLAVSDRPRKYLRVSDILTDGGNYDFVAGDEQKLIVLLADNANDDEITMNVPEGSKEDAEYKILFTKGNNEFTNNKITYLNNGSGLFIYGRAIQNSDEDSIAVIKVMNDIVALSITYQSSVPTYKEAIINYFILDGEMVRNVITSDLTQLPDHSIVDDEMLFLSNFGVNTESRLFCLPENPLITNDGITLTGTSISVNGVDGEVSISQLSNGVNRNLSSGVYNITLKIQIYN